MYGNESTFTPTVLVHELFLRITQGSPLALADRNHFFAASAKAMRRNFCFGDDCTRAQRRDARWPQPAAKNIRYTSRPFSMRSPNAGPAVRSEEHTSELQSLMRNSYAVFCLKKKNT